MVTISGVFLDPDGSPVAGAVITFVQLKNTSNSFMRRDAAMTTAEDGSYSVQLYNGRYKVMAKYRDNSEAKLGEIEVSDSSGPGTLNDYLLVGTADDTPSPMFQAIEKMYFEMLAMMGDLSQLAKSVDGVGTDEDGNIPLDAYTPHNPPPAGVQSVDGVEADEDGNIPLGAYTAENPPPLVIPLPGAPGSSVMGSMSVSGSGSPGTAYKKIGETVSGSSIRPATLLRDKTQATNWTEVTPDFTSNLTGTWACAGYAAYGFGITLWTRIDKPVSLSAPLTRSLLRSAPHPVKNCQFSSSDHRFIDCEILNDGQWLPFTAAITDQTEYGRAIYSNALAGIYGPVKEYTA